MQLELMELNKILAIYGKKTPNYPRASEKIHVGDRVSLNFNTYPPTVSRSTGREFAGYAAQSAEPTEPIAVMGYKKGVNVEFWVLVDWEADEP